MAGSTGDSNATQLCESLQHLGMTGELPASSPNGILGRANCPDCHALSKAPHLTNWQCTECGGMVLTKSRDFPSSEFPRFTKIVTIKVGKGHAAADFLIHEQTLTKSSDFFRAALGKRWQEGQSRTIEMPEDDEETFSNYADWLYDGKLSVTLSGGPGKGAIELNNDAIGLEILLAKMYVLGEKVLDTKFCNAVTRAFATSAQVFHDQVTGFSAAPGWDAVNAIYDGTTSGSPIRQYLVDIWVSESRSFHSPWDSSKLHPDFARDMVKALMKEVRGGSYVEPSALPSECWFKDE